MDRVGMVQLSSMFRDFCGQLSTFALQNLERQMKDAFSIKNLSNVQKWTRSGVIQRNFINASSNSLDLDMRISFARGLLEQRPPGMPVKVKEFTDMVANNGKKIREYLQNDFVRKQLKRVFLDPIGGIAFEYDASSNVEPDDSFDEDDLEEFR